MADSQGDWIEWTETQGYNKGGKGSKSSKFFGGLLFDAGSVSRIIIIVILWLVSLKFFGFSFFILGILALIGLWWIVRSNIKSGKTAGDEDSGEKGKGSGGGGGRGGDSHGIFSSVRYGAGRNVGERMVGFLFSGTFLLILLIILAIVVIGKNRGSIGQTLDLIKSSSTVEGISRLYQEGKIGANQYRVASFFTKMKLKLIGRESALYKKFAESYSFRNPNAQEQEVKKGAKVYDSLKPLRNSYREVESPILQSNKIHLDAMDDVDSDILFYCRINDLGADISVDGIPLQRTYFLSRPVSTYRINRKNSKDVSLKCKFNPISVEKESEVRQVEFGAVYSGFTLRSKLKVYSLKSDILQNLDDPFANVNDRSLIKSERETIPECVSGCGLAQLSMGVFAEQPLTEKGEYSLGFRLLEATGWEGRVTNLDSVAFYPPEDVTTGDNCDFDKQDNKRYTLKKERLSEVNIKLNLGEDVDITFWCDFTIDPNDKIGQYSEFRAETVYDYGFEFAPGRLEIRKSENKAA